MSVINSGSHTVVGRRESNEDAMSTDADSGFFIIADGAGGGGSGQIAAQIACEVVSEDLTKRDEDVKGAIEAAIAHANEEIVGRQESDPKLHGMATTIVVLVVSEGQLHVGHVGDSRAYLLRNGELSQLTRDHSLENYLADNPEVSPKVQRPGKTLMRALGLKSEGGQEPDHHEMKLEPNDVVIGCTDGVSSFIPEWTLKTILEGVEEGKEPTGAGALTRAALAHGSMDNATAVVLRAAGEQEEQKTLGWITFLEGDRQGDVITLEQTEQQIGRDDACAVTVLDEDTAEQHAEIRPVSAGGFQIADLGQEGGTFINNVHIDEAKLVDGDVIRVGRTKMVFKCHTV